MKSFLILLIWIAAMAAAAPQPSTIRDHFVRIICSDLSPEDCKAKAGACHPGRYMLRIKD